MPSPTSSSWATASITTVSAATCGKFTSCRETPEFSGYCSYLLLRYPVKTLLRKALSIALTLLLSVSATAQNNYFKGEVRDEQGTILQNVSILQAATGYFAYSGPDGTFGILSKQSRDTLVFSLDGYEKRGLLADAAQFLHVTLRKAPRIQLHHLASRTPNLRFDQQQQWFNGDETYASTVENGFVSTHEFPSTGLSLNVDRASYSNVRRLITGKSAVPPEAVRIEELLNYFNFDYREPAAGANFDIEPVLSTCPWNEGNWLLLAHIRSRKLPLAHLPPSNLVFLVDVSASMDAPNRLPLLKAGFKGLVQNLRAADTVSIVVYGGSVEVYLRPTGGDRKAEIIRAIDALETGGTTPGASGVRMAYQLAREHFLPRGNNRVILATDGDFNVGLRSESELEDLISEERNSGVYLTCLGVGMGNYKDSKIQALAQKGNGNFAYIDNFSEAQKVLVKEFTGTLYSVGDDASLLVRFDPSVVKRYRLIGFDNKVGAMKDTSAAIEGGEVGSGSSLLVAYEIEPTRPDAAPGYSARFSLHYREPGALQPCTDHLVPALQLQPFASLARPYRFASAVILFGSLLKESRHVREKSWSEILPLAQSSADPDDALQKEFVQIVEKAKAIYTSRKRKKSAP
ncbi:MAG: VWA domain-containing protein [Chitinophagaceae bacterium]|nr:MAG: VWA domain-containing protein [Chitinophagaceae bacterium]